MIQEVDEVTDAYHGSCLCGAIEFEADAFTENIAHCHCSMCRKFHGAAYATIAGVTREHFRWLRGEDLLRSYTAENGTTRSFCGRCGSSLVFSSPRAPEDIVEIALGAFDGDLPVRPDAHIYVESGANWVSMASGDVRYKEGRSSARMEPLIRREGSHVKDASDETAG